MTHPTHKLQHLWSQWTGLLDDVVHRRRRVARVTDEAYRELHRALLAEISAQVDRCKSVQHSLPKEMFRLAAPWLTLDALVSADRHILVVLCRQARKAQVRLTRGNPRRRWVLVAISVVIAILSGLAAAIVIPMAARGELGQTIRQLQHMAYRLEHAVAKASLLTKLGVFAIIVITMGTLLLRTTRQD